jgi:ATP-dependent DNA helicase RecQ
MNSISPAASAKAAASPSSPKLRRPRKPSGDHHRGRTGNDALTIPWPRIAREARDRFKITRFRPGQREIMEAVFRGRNTLGLMPTGSGKSLTFQLPALLLPHPVIVVSPLISLMQDQQQKAEQAEIVVEKLDSTLTSSQAAQAAEMIDEGIPQLIYVTPERLEDRDFLHSLNNAGGISLLVVDEAHCIPQWGHDFRPAYLNIGEARKVLGDPPVLALTATATQSVIEEILSNLRIPDALVINEGTERENLSLAVIPTVNNEAKLARILSMVGEEQGSGIIYTASIRSANELFDYLKERDISVARYHGKMPTRERERLQAEFMRGDHKVMIATKAFGLGIDKPDIRFVFHFEFPDSLETYFQEAGRAGRDGLPSRAVLLYRLEDKRIQSYFLSGRYPHLAELRSVMEALPSRHSNDSSQAPHQPLSAGAISEVSGVGQRRTQVILHLLGEAGLVRPSRRGYLGNAAEPPSDTALEDLLRSYEERALNDKDRLAIMMHYAETVDCRTQTIRRYFADQEGEPCRRCDNCHRNLQTSSTATRSITPSEAAETQSQPAKLITEIETKIGTIVTTAPETLPTPQPPPRFHPGETVRHRRFGTGTVIDIHQDDVLVQFEKAGKKRIRISFLAPAR